MSDPYDSPAPSSRRGLIGAAAALVVIVVLGVIVTFTTLIGDDEPTQAGPSEPTSSSTEAAPACDLGAPSSSSTTLNAPPADATWDLINGIAVPSSEQAGPGTVEESGVRHCFARTPEGALLAAANLFGWAAAAESDPEAIADYNIASGPGQEAFRVNAAGGFEGGGSSSGVQIQGFRLLSYSSDAALVDLALGSAGETGFAHIQLELVWEEGDWRIRLLPDGSIPAFESVPDLSDYIRWNGA